MSARDWKDLVNRVRTDVRSTEDEVSEAEGLARQCKESSSAAAMEAEATLRKMLKEIEGRDHRSGGDSKSGRAGHATLAWRNLNYQLDNAEQKWERIANAQFWLGILMVPLVLIAAVFLALGSIKVDPAGGVFLTLVVGAAVTHSFLVLRIHQQARQAEERIVEKRVGLAFLRIAVEDHAGNPEFEAMIQAGTQMFLGHHAAATIPLSPEDLRAALPKA